MATIQQVGVRQRHWLYGGPNCWDRIPFKYKPAQGAPPPVLRGLIEQGLMWSEKRERRPWQPRGAKWGAMEPGAEYLCGLTPKGRQLIEDRKNRSPQQARAGKTANDNDD